MWLAATKPSPASVWLASESELLQVDTVSGNVSRSFPVTPLLAIAAASDSRVWTLTNSQLKLIGAAATSTPTLDLASLGFSSATLLAVNPYDESVWVATQDRTLLHVNRDALL